MQRKEEVCVYVVIDCGFGGLSLGLSCGCFCLFQIPLCANSTNYRGMWLYYLLML